MKKQIQASVFLGLSLFLTTGFSALQAYGPWEGGVEGNNSWDCCDESFLKSAQPCCKDCGPYVGAEFIYWTQYKIDRDYAVDGASLTVGETTTRTLDGKYHHTHARWDPGFRIDLGYRWGCDGWDTALIWTRYHTKNSSSARPGEGASYILPTLWPSNTTLDGQDIAVLATASEHLNYDVLDFIFERPYFVSCTHTLRPFFGVRGLWLHQKLSVDYNGGANVGGIAFGTTVGSSSWGSQFEGAGLIAGLGYEMLLCNCISLYADFSGSLLAGQHRNHFEATLFATPTTSVGTTLLDVNESENSLLPGYHIGTGLSWETNLCSNCVVVKLGYEFNQWFNTPEPRRYVSTRRGLATSNANGSILFHGLNVGANLYF